MAKAKVTAALGHIRRLIDPRGGAGPTDGQLLERFAAGRDEAAFEELVRRHGPLVLGLCRRVLAHPQDAEDAFQATFLVLARKAASIRQAGSVASWLYGVAYRVAQKARGRDARRRAREKTAADLRPAELFPATAGAEPAGAADAGDLMDLFPETVTMRAGPVDEVSRREVCAGLDEELGRLPEKYRAPLLLCDTEGHSHAEAARVLAWAAGTLKTRLARGRELLRARLARRGITLSGGALAGLLAAGQTRAAVPGALLRTTTHAALAFTAGRASAGAVSVEAADLAEGMLHTMTLGKVKTAALVGVMVGLLSAASAALVHRAAEPPLAAPAPQATPADARPQAAPARRDRHGDPLPAGAVARLGPARLRHGSSVFFVAFLAGGKQVLSAGEDGLARLWDVATGKEVRRFGTPHPVPAGGGRGLPPPAALTVALAPDDKVLATSAGEGGVRLWDTATGRERGLVKGLKADVVALALSPDGKTLAAAEPDGPVVLWDLARGQELRRLDRPAGEGIDPKVVEPGAPPELRKLLVERLRQEIAHRL
jgi:RNA polymerase sigma factor (sigma-70 family)